MLRIITIIIFCTLFSWIPLTSQIINGHITDQQGDAISYVTIFQNNGANHTHSDDNGRFQLTGLSLGDTLNFRFLGYDNLEIILRQEDFNQLLSIILREKAYNLNQVVVSNQASALHQIAALDLKNNPVNSSQEILQKVPGLFIAQHAGGGKAEQIFLRGFDIDHGTDININVDGMPVNMVSHAHGQGYADLHFLIPETIESIDFGKGPYYTNQGNFTTAGYVNFQTKERLNGSSISQEYGRFNTIRTVSLIDLLEKRDNQHAYLAGEYLQSSGPFESDQHFHRINLLGKYSAQLPNNGKFSLLASYFQSRWDASGQIPQRAVENGLINRFGAIDDTEGGATSRTNLAFNHTKILSQNSFIKTNAYFVHYDFELFSNFTFFLDDPENGDQIKQKEQRNIFGLESILHRQFQFQELDFNLQGGLGFRQDRVENNELSHTLNRRTTLEPIALGNINESNFYGFANAEVHLGNFLLNFGFRLDHFKFNYVNQLSTIYQTLSESATFLSPKLNLIYNPNLNWQIYLKSGIGFHSNDTRVVVAQNGEDILPAAYGIDLGTIWKPSPRLWINAAFWYLYLQQEFVYVGDAGIVEPSGKTRRLGLDLSMRYQLNNWLFFDADLNYTYARPTEEPENTDRIPLAPELTTIGGLTIQLPSGFSGSLRYRYIKDRPANEDNSIVAKGYFLTDLNLNYSTKNTTFGLSIENLFNVEWNEAQFATLSRLSDEPQGVEELHFTPGTPFFLKGKITYHF